jgi:HSP20 family protein
MHCTGLAQLTLTKQNYTTMKKTLFDELFWNGFGALDGFNLNYGSPKVTKKDSSLLVEVALPGYTKDEVSVEVEGRTLTIAAEIAEADQTFFKKTFKKMYELPDDVDADQINAKLENGLLTLTMGKTEKVTKVNIL